MRVGNTHWVIKIMNVSHMEYKARICACDINNRFVFINTRKDETKTIYLPRILYFLTHTVLLGSLPIKLIRLLAILVKVYVRHHGHQPRNQQASSHHKP